MGNIQVINIKGMAKDSYTYIGRGSVLGNYYNASALGRKKAISLYRLQLWSQLQSLGPMGKAIIKLASSPKDLVLGCHCKPLACHGDVIKAAILWVRSQA